MTFETEERLMIRQKDTPFNPHFLSMTFETLGGEFISMEGLVSFNPHFLSMTFETQVSDILETCKGIFQSSFSEYDL